MKKYPKVMKVFDRFGDEPLKRTVVSEIPGEPNFKYVTTDAESEEILKNEPYIITLHRYAVEIDVVELDEKDELLQKATKLYTELVEILTNIKK